MTTTEIDFALPVSFTLVRQAGNDQLVRADGGGHYRLEGPSVVAASWSGPQKAELWHHHNTGAGFQWRKLAEFNGGGGEPRSESEQNPGRKSWCMSVLRRLRRMWPRTTEGRSRFIRSSSWGGGVGDGTTGNGLDALACDQACHDGGQYTRRDSGRAGSKRHGQRFLAPRRCASAGLGFRRGAVDVDLRRAASSVWNEWAPQGKNRPRYHGQAGDRAHIRLHGRPVETHLARNHHLSDSCVLATTSTGGGR